MTKNYYTPKDIIERARKTMGSIDLDPASCGYAQKIVKAKKYYTETNSGLDVEWKGNVWLNPPYSVDDITKFANKLKAEKDNIDNIIVLINKTSLEKLQNIFGVLSDYFSAILIPTQRIKFYDENGKYITNIYGNVILFAGGDVELERFIDNFKDLGSIWSDNEK